MSIVRDDCDERQIRVDRMIDEFHKAQSRRRAKATAVKDNDRAVEPQNDAHAQTAGAGSTTAPSSHSND